MNISGEMPLALITGAARRVGKLIALHLARKGYAIGLHFNSSESEAQQTAAEIREIGAPVYLFEADLAKEEEITDLFKKVNKVSHPLKVLVNQPRS